MSFILETLVHGLCCGIVCAIVHEVIDLIRKGGK